MTRLLFVRSEHLGDVAVTLPAAAAVRRALPGAEISYLVAQGLRTVPESCPAVDEVEEAPFPPVLAPFRGEEWERETADLAASLRGRFDIALVFRPFDPWSVSLVANAGIPLRVGYSTAPAAPHEALLTHRVPHRGELHASAQALSLAEVAITRLTGRAAPIAPRPLLFPSRAGRAEAVRALLEVGVADGGQTLVMHPGVGWQLKQWSPERWGHVAARLSELGPVVVTGTTDEAGMIRDVVTASRGTARGLVGRLSLRGLVALLASARLVVGADSGPLHLAALAGTPVVGLYGPFSAGQAGPWAPPERWRAVEVAMACRPCGTLTSPPCGAVRDPACITAVGPAEVVTAALELLSAELPPSREAD